MLVGVLYGNEIPRTILVYDLLATEIHILFIDDYANVGGDGPLPRCIAFELQIFNNSVGI